MVSRIVRWMILSMLLSPLVVACGEDFDVYILTGQSNSLGTTQYEGTTPSEYGPGSNVADLETDFFWSNVSASNTTYPPVLYGDSGGAISQLQMQQGGVNNPTFWGPEFGFARRLHHHPGRDGNILVIKASRGGGGNTYWDRTTFSHNPGAGHMWGHVRDTIDSALSQLVGRGDQFSVKGLLYLQGESNNSTEAARADTRLRDFIANLQAHLHTQFPGTADDVRTVIGEIAASQSNANRQLTTQRQMQLAANDASIAFIHTRDLPLKSDGIHFGRAAKLAIGRRFASAILGYQIRPRAFDEIAGHAAATDLVFDDYVPDLNGNQDGPILVQDGTFRGFAEGANGQPAAGLIVDGSAERVVFADYIPNRSMSVIAAGGFDFVGQGQPASWTDSGDQVTFTFRSPEHPGQQAAVSAVAFRLWGAAGDNVRATFLDEHHQLLFETGVLDAPDGVAFEAVESFTGQPSALIHQVVISGDPGTLWGVGMYQPPPPREGGGSETLTPDFSFTGFTVIPEPAAAWCLCWSAGGLLIFRRPNRCRGTAQD